MGDVDLLRVHFLGELDPPVGDEGWEWSLEEVGLHLGVGDPDVGVLVARYRALHVENVELVVDAVYLFENMGNVGTIR